MATRKKVDIGSILGKTAAASAAGFAADKAQDLLIEYVPGVDTHPGIAPGIVAAGAFAALYFSKDEYIHAAAYGALGSVGAQVGDMIIPVNGFSRVVYSNDEAEPVGRTGRWGNMYRKMRRNQRQGQFDSFNRIQFKPRNIAAAMQLPDRFDYSDDATE